MKSYPFMALLFALLFQITFASDEAPLSPICEQTPESGACKLNMPMYFFNATTGLCQRFVYRGCDGNGNRFATIEECRRTCGSRRYTQVTDICLHPKDSGPCHDRPKLERYYFDWVEGDCFSFNFTGCLGNENNFLSLEECRLECAKGMNSDHRKHFCSLRNRKGPCGSRVRRYFYNIETQQCEPFAYGGCDGNLNNFKSRDDCEKACANLFTY